MRNTAASKGRTAGDRAGHERASRHLHYGRVILDAGEAPLRIETGDQETGFICLSGTATVTADGAPSTCSAATTRSMCRETAASIAAGPRGAISPRSPRRCRSGIRCSSCKFADVQRDPGLHFNAGGPASKRDLNVLIGKNVEAGRIMAGVTFSEQGNWTSWPPHEHAAMLEEAYLYIDMPAPAFGIQLVYTNPREPELATIVREGDVVMMPQGYHPNVAAPGGAINFLWMMAAVREDDDRQYGVVNVHPEFRPLGLGSSTRAATESTTK